MISELLPVPTTETDVNPRIRSALSAVAASTLAAASLSLATASPAAAFGQETFGCRLSPGTVLTWKSVCSNSKPSSRYNAAFAVLNTSGDYTYSWTIGGDYTSIVGGCTATSSSCAIALPGSSTDSLASVTVTYSQGGQSATRTAHAVVFMTCGTMYC
jgi:hypothetical protein